MSDVMTLDGPLTALDLRTPPGRRLDALVAVCLMGARPEEFAGPGASYWQSWAPSTDPRDAWRVLDVLSARCPGVALHDCHEGRKGWFVTIANPPVPYRSDPVYTTVEGLTAPHALCLAALSYALSRPKEVSHA
jgi:hypothetical protein